MNVKEIDANQLAQWVEDDSHKLRVIDVRQMEEIMHGTVPKAEALPLHVLPAKVHELDKTEKLIMVCRSGARSAQACMFLQHGHCFGRTATGTADYRDRTIIEDLQFFQVLRHLAQGNQLGVRRMDGSVLARFAHIQQQCALMGDQALRLLHVHARYGLTGQQLLHGQRQPEQHGQAGNCFRPHLRLRPGGKPGNRCPPSPSCRRAG
jgi:rhodanese-related sulfurtransferase